MTLRNPRRVFFSRIPRLPVTRGWKNFCAAVVAVAIQSSSAPTGSAQTPSIAEADRCALINLANYYLRCANVNNTVLALVEDGIKRNPAGAAKEQRDAAAVMKSLVNDFITVSFSLYQRAGQQLTPEIAKARERADEKDITAALEGYLSRLEAIMKARIKGQKVPDPTPNRVLELCARPKLGQEIREPSKIDARFLLFHQEAKQLLSQNKSCLK